jgi:hypothetical protein
MTFWQGIYVNSEILQVTVGGLGDHVNMGSLPAFAAIAHRKNWIATLSIRFLQIAQFSLRAQRRSQSTLCLKRVCLLRAGSCR